MAITTTTTHPPATPHPRSTITAPTTNRNLSQMPRIHSPPPPMGCGQGLPPSNPTSRLPQLANNCPPPSPAPPPDADSSDLYPLFLVANSSHSGSLSESELGSALVNADCSAFDPYTIKMMMRMFSTAIFHPCAFSPTHPLSRSVSSRSPFATFRHRTCSEPCTRLEPSHENCTECKCSSSRIDTLFSCRSPCAVPSLYTSPGSWRSCTSLCTIPAAEGKL